MNRAQINQQLFNQAASIYSQMGQGVPTFTGKPGGGRFTSFLQQVIQQGTAALAQYRQRQLQQQLQQAQQAKPSAPQRSIPKTLKSTLGQADAGVRGAKSNQMKMAQQRGVRASNQLQAGPYLSPTGGMMSSPYGSSINLA
jgi:histidinol dehydrogenase